MGDRLAGKVALVTGVGGGIGETTARRADPVGRATSRSCCAGIRSPRRALVQSRPGVLDMRPVAPFASPDVAGTAGSYRLPDRFRETIVGVRVAINPGHAAATIRRRAAGDHRDGPSG